MKEIRNSLVDLNGLGSVELRNIMNREFPNLCSILDERADWDDIPRALKEIEDYQTREPEEMVWFCWDNSIGHGRYHTEASDLAYHNNYHIPKSKIREMGLVFIEDWIAARDAGKLKEWEVK